MMKFDWKQWANVLMGLLVIVFAFTGGHVMRFVIVGAIVVILAAWAAMEKKKS